MDHFNRTRFSSRVLGAALLLAQAVAAHAQSEATLYAPEPPANSAYVRVIHLSSEKALDLVVDGDRRVGNLAGTKPSDYLVLAAGKHTLALKRPGNPSELVSMTMSLESGRAFTVAVTALRQDAKPLVFEDKANSNMLKAGLTVYHLDAKAGPVDVLTADGKTTVFSNLAPDTSRNISVNPIKVELMVARTGTRSAMARATVAMSPGGTYSFLILPGAGGKPVAQAVQNKVERYSGK